jgi:trans-aconitate methyltransferase
MTNTTDQPLYESGWGEWEDMKEYGPASRHIRRLIFQLLSKAAFTSVLDVGCGVGNLLNEIHKKYPGVFLNGAEYAQSGLEVAKKRIPEGKFQLLDLSKESLTGQFDLVTCIDVLEHIPDDISALKNLRAMTEKYLLVVVPLGPLFEVERTRVGHVHGYSRHEFDNKLQRSHFRVIKSIQWGFPFYNLYRRILHHLPESTVNGSYGLGKRVVSKLLYFFLFINLPIWGERYFALCQPI